MTNRAIPLVDLDTFVNGNETQRAEFVQALGDAFHNIGFVSVVNHGIPKELVDGFYQHAKAFFALPTDIKRQYEKVELAGQRGYTSFGREKAKQSEVADLKEFFQIGQVARDENMSLEDYPENIKTAETPEFTDLGEDLYRVFEQSGAELLKAIALYIGLEEDYFQAKIHHGNSIIRAIHYPPILEEPKSAIRAEEHEDINLITLLVGASAGGLQVMDKQGNWLDAVAGEDEIVVNVGDMLQRLTNNYLKSTTHRVVNPPRELWHTPRLSIPFFLHPRAEMDLTCLETYITEETPLAYEPITAGAYLDERLREIGLKK